MSPICEQACAVIRRRESPSAQDRPPLRPGSQGTSLPAVARNGGGSLPNCQPPTPSTNLVFRNAGGAPLTRDGVAYVLEKYMLVSQTPRQLLSRRVTPPVMRHRCAVALLQAGIDASVIPDYLGHAGVATTSGYVTTNLKMKRDVLEAF